MERITVTISKVNGRMVQEMKRKTGLTVSDLIRRAIETLYKDLLPEKQEGGDIKLILKKRGAKVSRKGASDGKD